MERSESQHNHDPISMKALRHRQEQMREERRQRIAEDFAKLAVERAIQDTYRPRMIMDGERIEE